jgi:L(+)-tartrate dehydratase alpha subunit
VKTNVGDHYPSVEIFPDSSIESIEVTAVPKGGGSEISGTFYKMLYPSDGLNGIIHFVTESFLGSAYAGKTCPPNIIGIGIGGTADMCMGMAKRAAVLRPIGDRHPQPEVAKLELDLLSALNDLGLGPMGSGGQVSVLDVHVEKALVHTGALPVAFSSQCSLCRRATGRLSPDGDIQFVDDPRWRES